MTVSAQGELGKLADNRGARPRLRGWLHVVAFFGWLVGGPFLVAAGPDPGVQVALAVYVTGMLVMFGTYTASAACAPASGPAATRIGPPTSQPKNATT